MATGGRRENEGTQMAAKPVKREQTREDNIIHWRRDADRARVWRSGWFGDQFEVFPLDVWMSAYAPAIGRLGFSVVEHGDEDE